MSYKYKDENGIIHDIADNYEVQEPGYEVYSLQETLCGEWIGKPLYRKIIPITIQSSGTSQVFNHGIDNIKEVVNISGTFANTALTAFNPIPQFFTNANGVVTNYVRTFVNNLNQITIELMGTTFAGRKGYIVLEYTKTTD